MNFLDIGLLVLSVVVALVSRAMMKRYLVRQTGRANLSILELDSWRAGSGEVLGRSLVLLEIASWIAIILLVFMLA